MVLSVDFFFFFERVLWEMLEWGKKFGGDGGNETWFLGRPEFIRLSSSGWPVFTLEVASQHHPSRLFHKRWLSKIRIHGAVTRSKLRAQQSHTYVHVHHPITNSFPQDAKGLRVVNRMKFCQLIIANQTQRCSSNLAHQPSLTNS